MLDTDIKGRFYGIIVMANQEKYYVTPFGCGKTSPMSSDDLFNQEHSAQSETMRFAYCNGAISFQIVDAVS